MFLTILYMEEEMGTHSSVLAWKIPWTEEPGRLQSMRVAKEWDVTEHAGMHAPFMLTW